MAFPNPISANSSISMFRVGRPCQSMERHRSQNGISNFFSMDGISGFRNGIEPAVFSRSCAQNQKNIT